MLAIRFTLIAAGGLTLLLQACAARLAPKGLILFSNNNRRFKLDGEALAPLNIRDITPATIAIDFARDQKIHHCFEIRHR